VYTPGIITSYIPDIPRHQTLWRWIQTLSWGSRDLVLSQRCWHTCKVTAGDNSQPTFNNIKLGSGYTNWILLNSMCQFSTKALIIIH